MDHARETSDPAILRLVDVSVVYPPSRCALRDVSLNVAPGEFVFVVGTTGAGKSTLLKLLYRAEVPTSGTVEVSGVDVGALPHHAVPALRRRMGVVFQDFALLPDRTVFENVAFALRVIGAGRRAIRRRVPAALEQVALVHRCDAFPHQLSGGEQQRVAIARALVNNPPLLIADEPTGNLDPDTSLGIAMILDEINHRGTTVVVATHDRHMVDNFPRRVIEFDRGCLVRDDRQGAYAVEPVEPGLSH
ncbi:MAG TPA: cell division ATP-binding protein FtsE [Chthonomonadales bacterium]|nr:cell division ATP-binding protein FtsE [Chthonomonadales bacterium]